VELTLNKSLSLSPSFVASHHKFAFIQQRGEATFHQLIFGHTFLTHRIVLLSSAEHNLPDSPFASPTKSTAAFAHDPFAPTESEIAAAASPGRNAD
jgi:hypothetical protein